MEYKIAIAETKSGKTLQIVLNDEQAAPLMGKKIGDKIKGESIDRPGYEFEITGGSDYCGFPMRRDVEGPVRKKILITSGVGIRNTRKGVRKIKTVCGNTIHKNISLVCLKVLKAGKTPLFEEPKEEPKEEAKSETAAEAPKE